MMTVTSTEVRDDLGAVVANVSVMQDRLRLRELERRRMERNLRPENLTGRWSRCPV